MKNGLCKIQYLLYTLLVLAMAGCGAHNLSGNNADGSVAAKLVYNSSKSTAKTVAAPAPATLTVTSLQVTVTGSDATGAALPVVRVTPAAASTSFTVQGIYPGNVTLTVKAVTNLGVYEGFAINVPVAANATNTLANAIKMSPEMTKPQDAACVNCHETTLDVDGQNLVANFKQEGHYTNSAWIDTPKYGITGTGCAGCHGPQHNDANPAASGRCDECHATWLQVSHQGNPAMANGCRNCHLPHNVTQHVKGSCIECHALPQAVDQTKGPFVSDNNNGVRAITGEFAKWSHHVTGVTLQDAHCAACHLEGEVGDDGAIHINRAYHMVDATTHLRNAHDDSDMMWDPASPNHTTMDNFCMSCHSATGFNSPKAAGIQAVMVPAPGKTASALNPFGDTISNRYDKMQRPAVTNVDDQFNTTNNSHHAVKGKRYSGRTRTAGPRSIDSVAFANNSSNILKGVRSTIYDAGNFNDLYSPLGTDGTAATGLGDDSTLHCGDCHTVGQWKVGSSDTANGSPTPAAIGAHGSNNEYLLRNTLGTDQRHTQNAFTLSASNVVTNTNPGGAFLVCYNCHKFTKYGSIYVGTGLNVPGGQPHAGEYDQQGRCNGIGNTIPFYGYTTGKATDGTQFGSRFMLPVSTTYNANQVAPYAGEQNPDFGNIFGIQCANCHNSGTGNAFGGIHGSANNQNSILATVNPAVTGGAYIDGLGNTTKIERFLPGLGNAMHVPGTLGGYIGGSTANFDVYSSNRLTGANAAFIDTGRVRNAYTTGGITNDTNWEQKHWQQTASTSFNKATAIVSGTLTSAGAGCYTLGGAIAGGTAASPTATSALRGPSVTGPGGAPTALLDTWGGCEDHNAAQGGGDHGFVKAIVRPVTY